MQLFTNRAILLVVSVCVLGFSALRAQVPEDCEGAIIICSDEIINFNPDGIGKDDFANPNNSAGCLENEEEEGLWFFFSFRTDMPPNSEIEFTLTPLGVDYEDYDFAIYGPNLSCDSLGEPLRCSFFKQECYGLFGTPYVCPETGLGRGATDTSEGILNEDGFVAPIVVQPGEGFYMYIDNFMLSARAFQLEWGGSAAPYLNCLADPICNSKSVYAGEDEQLCFDDTVLPLQATLTNASAGAVVRWSAEPAEALNFLDNINILNPVANIPIGFSGEIVYGVTLIDEGCEKIDYIRVMVNRPDVTITGQNPFCGGDLNVLSAPEGYVSYRWSTGAATSSIEVTSPGLYWVEIVDSLGCVARGELQVNVFSPLLLEVEGPDTVCLNEVANLRATAGFADYVWSTNDTGPNISVSGAGSYTVTATDGNGCTYTAGFTLREWERPAPTFSGDTNFCTGLSGTIIAGPGFQSYTWSNGESTPSITVTEGGIYTVTVTDGNSCEGTGAFEITKSSLPNPIITGTLNICAGSSTELFVDAGFRSISWSTAETTPSITVQVGGQYSVMVEDAQGCQGLDTVTVTENARPELLTQGTTGFCPGEKVILDPGQDFVLYAWSTGESTSTITVDQVGAYGLTVTDANGCEAKGEIDVVAYPAPSLDLSRDLSFCRNDSVSVRVNQNYPAYLWSDGRSGKSVFFSQAGDYAVTITDGNGCHAIRDFVITMDTLPAVRIEGDTAICQRGSTTFKASPGFITYQWSTGATTPDILVSRAGVYELTVTDSNGCTGMTSASVVESPPPLPVIEGDLGICPGVSTQLRVIGPYKDYVWSNGARTAEVSIVQPGVYTVIVTDNIGCRGSAAVTVNNRPAPTPKIVGRDAFCEGYTSVLQLTESYESYRWSTQDTRYLTVINTEGLYSVTVTDRYGCEGTDSKFVKVNPRPKFEIAGNPDFCPGEQTVLDAGSGFEAYIWSTGNRAQTQTVGTPGYYSVVVRDSNKCLLAKGIEVVQNPSPQPVVAGDPVICREGGETTLTLNQTFKSYRWSNGMLTPSIRVTDANVYSVTVTDNNDCRANTSFAVQDQLNPVPEITGDLGFCIGGSTELRIPEPYVSYVWSTGATIDRVRIDRPGNYGVTVTDALGCVGMRGFTIEEFSKPLVDLEPKFDVCPDVTASIDGGPGFVSYLWSTGATTRILETDQPGFYALTVTDANGCVDSTSTRLVPLERPVIALPNEVFFCPGTIAQVEVDTGFLAYIWSDGSLDRILMTSTPGPYQLTVIDSNGCEIRDTLDLLLFATTDPEIVGPDSLCVNANSLLSAGQDFVSYRWSYQLNNGGVIPDTASAQLRIAGGGLFTVVATDENGCETSRSKTVTDVEPPVFDLTGDRSLCEGVEARLGVTPEFSRYFWSNGSQEASAVFFEPGTYTVTVENTYGCQSSRDFTLEEKESPRADPGPNVEFPCTDDQIRIGGTQSAQGPHIRYNWAGPGITADNYNVQNPVVSEPGEYFFLVRDTITGCQSAIARVEVIAGPGDYDVSLLVGDNIDCSTQTVEIDASRSEKVDSLLFQWLDSEKRPIGGATTPAVRVNGPGWYYLQTIFQDSRCGRLDSVEVRTDFLTPVAVAGRDQFLTCDRSAITLDAGASSRGVGIAYEWRLADAANTLLNRQLQLGVDRPGQYVLVVTNLNNGCSRSDTVEIKLDRRNPTALLAGDVVLDCLQPSGILDGSASDSGPDIVYRWRETPGGNPLTERRNQLPVNQAGRYALVVENERNGCADTAYAEVIDNISQLEIAGLDFASPVCASDRDGFIAIGEIQGGNGPYMYSFDGGQSFSVRNQRDRLPGGLYHLVVEDAEGCRIERKVELANGNTIEINLGPDQIIELGQQVEIEARIRAGKTIASFEWLDPEPFRQENSRTLVDIPFEDRTFVARVVDADGCFAVDTALVKVLVNRDVYVPNVFRPEGFDQPANSRFTVFASSQVREIRKLAIFDRWGDMVFENRNFAANDLDAGWDGTFRNQNAPSGVYVYFCEVVFQDGEELLLKGDVALVR